MALHSVQMIQQNTTTSIFNTEKHTATRIAMHLLRFCLISIFIEDAKFDSKILVVIQIYTDIQLWQRKDFCVMDAVSFPRFVVPSFAISFSSSKKFIRHHELYFVE